jgi:hypothetical protein
MADGKPITTYETEVPQTKIAIEREIMMYQDLLANPDKTLPEGIDAERRTLVIAEWQASLEAWQQAYPSAPEEIGGEIDLYSNSFGTVGTFTGAVDFGHKRKTYITVSGSEGEAPVNVEFNNLGDTVGLPFHFDLDSDFTNMKDVTISKDEAIRIGLDYIERLGGRDFTSALVLAGYCNPRTESSLKIEEWDQCYKILFTRSVAGVPTTYREDRDDTFVVAGYFAEEFRKENMAYAPYLPQEYISMVIRDTGVNYMVWANPSDKISIINENVVLQTFDDIIKRFKSQIQFEAFPLVDMEAAVIKETLIISRIELGMMQVRKKGTVNELLMIPTWTFFGKTVLQYSGQQEGGYPLNENNEYVIEIPGYSYLIINAIDGSVINPIFGY